MLGYGWDNVIFGLVNGSYLFFFRGDYNLVLCRYWGFRVGWMGVKEVF